MNTYHQYIHFASHPRQQFLYGILFLLTLLVTLWLYWDGLHSIFILDDNPNLTWLETIDKEPLTNIGRFVTEGIAGPSGRPISLLSFALQYPSWPAHPEDFKYVNLMIHLLNGCLVFWLLLLITQTLPVSQERRLLIAWLATALWLLHPLQVSTVLYVVQRMVELAALFTLAGLIAYLKGRQYLVQQRYIKGFIWASLGIAVGGILATLSKENGVLLILYVLALEATLLHVLPQPTPKRWWKLWFAAFIYVPLAILVVYFTTRFGTFLQGYEARDFTMGERLLSETRILLDYVTKIVLIQPYDFGLFHDDYIVSRGLFTPPTTVLAFIIVVSLFILAIKIRHSYPLLGFAILWFFAGHALESSFIGLMLYFEHRNYLAMLGILVSMVYGAFYVLDKMRPSYLRQVVVGLVLGWWLLFPGLARFQVDLWTKPLLQAKFWAQQKPFSRYALSHAASLYVGMGMPKEAEEYYRTMTVSFPKDTGPYALWIGLACMHEQQVAPPDTNEVLERFRIGNIDSATIMILDIVAEQYFKGKCRLDAHTMEMLMTTLVNNQNPTHYKGDIYFIYASVLSAQKRYPEAVKMGDKGLEFKEDIQMRMMQIAWLMTAKQWDEAFIYLQKARNKMNPISKSFYSKHLEFLESEIKQFQEPPAPINELSNSSTIR